MLASSGGLVGAPNVYCASYWFNCFNSERHQISQPSGSRSLRLVSFASRRLLLKRMACLGLEARVVGVIFSWRALAIGVTSLMC